MLSFKGKGTTVKVSVGGEAHDVDMTSSFERYELHITCSDATNHVFSMVSTNCVVCEIMLSYCKLAPAWSPSYSDNDKSMAEFQNLKFLTDAITQGSTTIDGGLVMSQQFKVGNYRDKKLIKETGGMSGYYNDDDSPFLWGGGTLEQAIYTIQKYKDNPNYEPTAEELNNLAKFVVTHGGRAILTDIILRGVIYAEGGVMKSIKSPNGNFEIDEEGNAKFKGDSEFGGKLVGVSGSFKRLNCVNDKGNVVGSIEFGSDGKMWFDGDMFSQGYNKKEDRSNRFYTSDVWCRGMFGHRSKTMAIVKQDLMKVFTRGTGKEPVEHKLTQGMTTSSNTYYEIPLFAPGGNDDTAGMPIDVILFNNTADYYYSFVGMDDGKEWRVINGNDNQTIHFCDIGGWHELKGGASVNCIYIPPEFLTPVPSSSSIGRGVFWTGETDMNWNGNGK